MGTKNLLVLKKSFLFYDLSAVEGCWGGPRRYCLVCGWAGTVGHQFDGWDRSDQGWHESSQHTMADGGRGSAVAGFACVCLACSSRWVRTQL